MGIPGLVLLILAVALVVLRHVAARRLESRKARYVWLVFGPTLLIPAVVISAGVGLIGSVPLAGLVMTIVGVAYLGYVLQMVRRFSRAYVVAKTPDERASLAFETFANFSLTLLIAGIIGTIALGLGLAVWAVATGGS